VDSNALECVPSEVADLQALQFLHVRLSRSDALSRLTEPDLQLSANQLRWLPIEFDRLPAKTRVLVRSFLRRVPRLLTYVPQVRDNPLPLMLHPLENARPRLLELFAATTHIGMIRERAATICFAMQDLELPAPLTLEILDALFPPNSIRMWAKWKLITTINHFHQRHERAGDEQRRLN
jgi:hypothetical protein